MKGEEERERERERESESEREGEKGREREGRENIAYTVVHIFLFAYPISIRQALDV